MELIQFLRILLRRWWLILIPVVIVALITLPSLLNGSPAVSGGYSARLHYSAAQSMSAIPRQDGDYQDIWLSSELAINAFTEWIVGSRFKEEVRFVADELGVELNVALLGIGADNERSVGRIDLSYPTEEGLSTAINAVIQVLQTRNQDYFAQLGGVPATVTILDQTLPASAPPPIADRLGVVLRFGLAFAAGLGLAVLAHYLDPFIRRKDEVEKLGLPVISLIPPSR